SPADPLLAVIGHGICACHRPSVCSGNAMTRTPSRGTNGRIARAVRVPRPVDAGPGPCFRFRMARAVEADYLVVGAGAMGMAFTDALIDHADVRVALVDRRGGVGGDWAHAYPFVRLHQASVFYGVASTLLGGGRIQQDGPEAGLHERATAPEICAYYARVLQERLFGSGRVSFYPGCDYVGDGQFVSRVSGNRYEV